MSTMSNAPNGPRGSRNRILARVSRALAGRERLVHPGRLETPILIDTATSDASDAADAPDALIAKARVAQAATAQAREGSLSGLEAAFAERLAANGGEVVVADSGPDRQQGEWLGDLLRNRRLGQSVAVASDVPAELRPHLPVAPPAEADVGIAVAWGAVAETGTLVLEPDGGRAVQLLPPVLVVWVPAGRVFGRLGDALPELSKRLPAVAGLHSGPSKSADIGRTIVTGVHGPGRCIAVLIPGPGPEET